MKRDGSWPERVRALSAALWLILVALLAGPSVYGQAPLYTLPPAKPNSSKSRFALSYRLGFNMGITFEDVGRFSPLGAAKLTPNGDAYNYDDGYVLPDISGSSDSTWYWGYDSGADLSSVSLTRSSVVQEEHTFEDLRESPEVSYWHSLGPAGQGHWGWMGAFNYTHAEKKLRGPFSIGARQQTDQFIAPAPPPPEAPYYGTYEGPVPGGPFRPLLSLTPSSTSSSGAGAQFEGSHDYEANLFGLKLGPYIVVPLSKQVSLDLSGGLALGLVSSHYRFNETVTFPGVGVSSSSGSSSDTDFRVGGFASAQLWCMLARDFGAFVGVDYQYLGRSVARAAGKEVTLDLRNNLFMSLGFGVAF